MAKITEVLARSTDKDVENTNLYYDEVDGRKTSNEKRKKRHLKVSQGTISKIQQVYLGCTGLEV